MYEIFQTMVTAYAFIKGFLYQNNQQEPYRTMKIIQAE